MVFSFFHLQDYKQYSVHRADSWHYIYVHSFPTARSACLPIRSIFKQYWHAWKLQTKSFGGTVNSNTLTKICAVGRSRTVGHHLTQSVSWSILNRLRLQVAHTLTDAWNNKLASLNIQFVIAIANLYGTFNSIAQVPAYCRSSTQNVFLSIMSESECGKLEFQVAWTWTIPLVITILSSHLGQRVKLVPRHQIQSSNHYYINVRYQSLNKLVWTTMIISLIMIMIDWLPDCNYSYIVSSCCWLALFAVQISSNQIWIFLLVVKLQHCSSSSQHTNTQLPMQL